MTDGEIVSAAAIRMNDYRYRCERDGSCPRPQPITFEEFRAGMMLIWHRLPREPMLAGVQVYVPGYGALINTLGC